MKRCLISVLTAFACAGTANAQAPGPADLQAVVNNLGPTVDTLVTGLGDTADTLISTQSAVQTSATAGETLVNTTSALVQGAPALGQLGLGAPLINSAVQKNLNPFLSVIDDPSQATINRVFDPQDLSTIASNLEATPEALLEGSFLAGNNQGLKDAAVALLQGNLADTALIPGPAALSSPGFALSSAAYVLLDGTNYGGVLGQPGAGFPVTISITNTVLNGALAPQLVPVEEGLVPVFDAATPLTDPLIQQIQNAQL